MIAVKLYFVQCLSILKLSLKLCWTLKYGIGVYELEIIHAYLSFKDRDEQSTISWFKYYIDIWNIQKFLD